MFLFFWLIFVLAAFTVASNRRVKVGFLFILITLLIPFIGIIWAFSGENKYMRWTEEEVKQATPATLKDALPYISQELKPLATKRLEDSKK